MKQWIKGRIDAIRQPKPPREPDPPGVATATMQFWFFIAVWAFALLGSLWMLVIFIAGSVGRIDWQTSYEANEGGVKTNAWLFAMDVHWSVGVGLFLFCAAIAVYNAVWLEMRRHQPPGLMRNILTGIGCAVALFMVSGATVVQQRGTDARARDDVIAAQSAQADKAGIQGKIDAIDARLTQMRDRAKNNEYAATAANVGEKAYRESYMSAEALARSPSERRDIIARAVGAAQAADALEAERATLTAQLATASVTTVVAEARDVKATGFMAGVSTVLEDARKPVTAILGELLAMTVLSAALAAWASRRAAMDARPPMPVLIEDHSAEAPLAVDPVGMEAPVKAQQYFDENGNRIVQRRATWAKVGAKRGKRANDTTEYEPAAAVSRMTDTAEGEGATLDSRRDSDRGADILVRGNVHSADAPPESEPLNAQQQDASNDRDAGQRATGVGADAGRGELADSRTNELSGDSAVRGAEAGDVHEVSARTPDQPLVLTDEPEQADPFIAQLKTLGLSADDPDLHAKLREAGFEVVDDGVIELPDNTYNYPRLPAPKQTEDAA